MPDSALAPSPAPTSGPRPAVGGAAPAPTTSGPAVDQAAAPVDRRFYAFILDRLLAWTVYAGAGAAAYLLLDDPWQVVGAVAGVVLLVGLISSLLLGLRGTSLGKSVLGLRLLDPATGRPVGVGRAMLRTLVLGACALPTLGIGAAALAWTALADRSGRRRGLHDRLAHGEVVDERPPPVEEEEPEAAGHQVVNLTAMRLVPAPSVPVTPSPAAGASRPGAAPVAVPPLSAPAAAAGASPAAPTAPSPPSSPSSVPPSGPPSMPPSPPGPPPGPARAGVPAQAPPGRRQRLGWPLVPAHRTPAPSGPPPASPPPGALPHPGADDRPPAPATPGGAHAASPGSAPPMTGSGHRTRGGRRRAESTAEREARQRPSAATRWRVSFDTGESLVVEGLTLVGRRPEARPGEPVRHLLPLRSQDMSLSKTHAQLQVADDGVLVVLDRGSTNGTFLVRQGAARPLPAGRATTLADGDRVRFGDREMTVVREGR